MRNILEALNVTPDGGAKKNPFDLSNYETFHQKGGQFNVVGVRDTVPDSDYRMSVDGFTKTMLCNTANFAHIKENYYFIHVPLGLISRNAYMMQVQRKENYSALDMDISQMPVFSLGKVLAMIFYIGQFNMDNSDMDFGPQSDEWDASFFDEHGYNIAFGALRLFDNLGYGYYLDILENMGNQTGQITYSQACDLVANLDEVYPSVARLAAYQCAWYHFFRNSIYNNDVPATCFNFDDISVKSSYNDPTPANFVVNEVRGAARFVLETCRLRYNPVKKDIFTASMPGTQWGAVSSVNLITDLEFNTEAASIDSGGMNITGLSYHAGAYGVNPTNVGDILTLPPNAVTGEYGDVVSEFAPNTASNTAVYTPHNHSVTIPSNALSIPSGTSLFDVLSLVEAQAIQKWRQKSMMAGNRTSDNWKAHYGVVPKHLQEHKPDFIGSVDNEIMVKEITSQANTLNAESGENNLGEIRGRGYGASDTHTFKFHSNDYGILLLIHAIVPENTYASFGLDKGNTLIFNTDFPQPEYNNIGLEVVPKYLANVLALDNIPAVERSEGTDNFLDTYNKGAFGYANRYYGHKQYVSKVHGLFNPSRFAESAFHNPTVDIFGYADMQSFVLTRNDFVARILYDSNDHEYDLTKLPMSISKLYVNPALFNNIFAVDADERQDTDVFFSHIRFTCQAMLPMPVLGLPKF